MKALPIKRAPTIFLKAVIFFIAAAVLVLCAFLFPQLAQLKLREMPEFTYVFYPALFGFYATAIPFFIALYQAFKLLHYIDKNNAFSELSIHALRNIKYCAVAMSFFYAMCMPLVFVFCELDDAPGGILMWAAVVCAPLIVATFAAVLQKLVQSAVDMKAENDLTI
jgi:hypothetical protein